MKKSIDLYRLASTIADALLDGITIGFRHHDGVQEVIVSDSEKGFAVSTTVNHPRLISPKDYRLVNSGSSSVKQPAEVKPVISLPDKGMPTVATIAEKKKNSKWWSRFNFEKNIMKMTLLSLQDRCPNEVGYRQDAFADRLAKLMSWQESTARRHIASAAKMGILNRAVIGLTYYITGVNDQDAETLREEMEDIERMPDNYYLEEGKPSLEMAIDKAVDESLLP